MGRKCKKRDGEPWDRITQACPGMKVRFDPAIIPELLAWLTLRGRRYQRVLDSVSQIPERDRTEHLRGVVRFNQTAVQLIDELMQTIFDRWSKYEWSGIVAELDKAIKNVVTTTRSPDTDESGDSGG